MTETQCGGVIAERERAARINEDLAERYEKSAEKLRHTGRRWFFGWYVEGSFERNAKALDAMANALRLCAMIIRNVDGDYK